METTEDLKARIDQLDRQIVHCKKLYQDNMDYLYAYTRVINALIYRKRLNEQKLHEMLHFELAEY